MVAFHERELREIDAEILRLAQSGRRREACQRLVEAYGAEIHGSCVARLGDPELGADAAQDVLGRALIGLAEYRGSAGLRVWLHRIAANRCIDVLRSQRTRKSRLMSDYELDSVAAPRAPMPSEALEEARERALRLEVVRAALDLVKDPDRRWVELHYTHGVAYDDIAAEEGLSRAAVKQRIWRAIKKVRAALAARGVLPSALDDEDGGQP